MERARRGQELIVATDASGILVKGPAAVVDQVVHELLTMAGGRGRVVTGPHLADGIAAVAAGFSVAKSRTEYVQFAAKGRALLAQFGASPGSETGLFSMFVRGEKGHFAGNLEWRSVALGPEQALALQQAAALFALRAAIKGVQDAVERVEGEIEHLVTMIEAKRLGDALGDRRVLTGLVGSVQSVGALSETDWSSVAPLGPQIAGDIESLRAYVRRTVGEADPGGTTRHRADEADQLLAKNRLREALAILLVCEENFGLWQALRMANVRQREPAYLLDTIDRVQAAIAHDRVEDQRLLDDIRSVTANLARPTGIEGFAPMQRAKLGRAREDLEALASWFAEQRLLDIEPLPDLDWPTVAESARHVLGEVAQARSSIMRTIRVRRSPAGADVGDAQPVIEAHSRGNGAGQALPSGGEPTSSQVGVRFVDGESIKST